MKQTNPLLQFIPYIKEARREYIFGLSFSILNVGLGVIGMYILSRMFDQTGPLTHQIFVKSLIVVAGYGLILLVSGISNYIMNIFLVRGANKIYVNIQTKIYDHIQSLPIRYFDDMPAGAVVSRITNDVKQIRQFFVSTFIQIVVIVVKILFIYIMLFTIDIKFASVMLLLLPILFISTRLYNRFAISDIKGYRKKFSDSNALINEGYQNLEVIKAFNQEQNIIDNWDQHNQERYLYWKKLNIKDSLLLHNLSTLIRAITFIGIIYYYAYSQHYHVFGVTLGMVYLYINYTTDIIYRVADFTMGIGAYTRAVGAATNIEEILQMTPEIDQAGKTIEHFEGNIQFEHVYFSYDGEHDVLKDIHLTIPSNQTVAFVGATGSGKSTIMNLLVKFYQPTKGKLMINNQDIVHYSRQDLQQHLAIVLQDAFLFEGTLLENITPTLDENLALYALEKVGGSFILEQGRTLQSKIDIGGKNLSTGEKQLVCLARALAKNPKILILDESTANIDSQTEQYVTKAIEEVKQGRTTLIIAHRLSTIKNADCIYVLDKGQIIESGTHQQLIAQHGVYNKMYQTQVKS